MSLSATRRPYTSFTMQQVRHLRAHYAELPPATLATQLGVSTRQVYELARRHGIRRRAPNGAPEWRQAA